ncbi:hypothetical protein [Cloacibacterium normanense]|uniref:hypothetical protein n=1 Tax=Cloacibacterium normanense TaxID=237258 RepID=UPI0039190CEA
MKAFKLFIFLLVGSFFSAQNTYIDLTTTLALKLYSDNLEKQQQKTIDEQNNLQKAQTWVGSQMVVANNIQNKILKGLSEVSGTLQNGIQVKQIYQQIAKCQQYSKEISHLVSKHPQYSIFGIKASQKSYEQLLKIGTDISDVLTSGDLNLATTGDRYKLLFGISENVKKLKLWLLAIKLNLERAERLGFWNAINPFQSYINTDKSIVENIMRKYKHNF